MPKGLATCLLVLALFTAGCSATAQSESPNAQGDDVPRELGFAESDGDAAATQETESVREDVAPEAVPIEEIFLNNGIAPELATCYAEVLATQGVTEASDFNELADGISALTAEEADEMHSCLLAVVEE